jgi:hypothetical protein
MIRRLRWDAGINRMAADNDRRRHAEAVAEGEAALADVLSASVERFSGAADAIEQAITLLEQAKATASAQTEAA